MCIGGKIITVSRLTKAKKLKGIQLPPVVAKEAETESDQDMEEALQKLLEGRAPVPNQTVQCLLGHIEMSGYKHWVSIDNTVQKYPAFKVPKG